MTTIRRGRVLRLRGADVHVLDEGAGPVVLCLSGVAGAWYDWQPLADRLLPGHRVVRPDRPGAGLSGPPGDVLRAATEADRLADLVTSIGAGPVTVVAHSLGAPIGEVLARRHPGLVAALVLVDGSIEEELSGRPAAQAAALARRARRLAELSGARAWAPWARTIVDARTGGGSSVASAALRALARAVYGRAEVVAGIATELAGYRPVVDEALTARAVAPLAAPVTVVVRSARPAPPGGGCAGSWRSPSDCAPTGCRCASRSSAAAGISSCSNAPTRWPRWSRPRYGGALRLRRGGRLRAARRRPAGRPPRARRRS